MTKSAILRNLTYGPLCPVALYNLHCQHGTLQFRFWNQPLRLCVLRPDFGASGECSGSPSAPGIALYFDHVGAALLICVRADFYYEDEEGIASSAEQMPDFLGGSNLNPNHTYVGDDSSSGEESD